MDLLTREERENLIIEYNHLHEEIWKRGETVWLVHSILITGSLLITFQARIEDFPTPIVSLFLTLISFILQITTDKISGIDRERANDIRKQLGIYGPERLFKREIEGKWWYSIRKNISYGFFTVLVGVYLYLLLPTFASIVVPIVVGFISIAVAEIYDHLKRKQMTPT